jgi:hypothetical protein
MTESSAESMQPERTCAYRILRYTPNLVRDEWVNIGVLVYDPQSGERRLRLIEEQEEYARLRRLHPEADESLLRALRDNLEDRFDSFRSSNGHALNGGGSNGSSLQDLLRKWDDTLSNALQLAPQKGVISNDLDAELERLYGDHVALPRLPSRVGTPGSRAQMRSYCSQVFRQARIWDRIQKSVRASEFTFPAIPCASITATAAMARADSFRRSPYRAHPPTPRELPTHSKTSPPNPHSKQNLPPSRIST